MAGKIEAYGDRGVWVADGLTAQEIMIGADILERKYDIPPYTSRQMVSEILLAVRALDRKNRSD